MAISEKTTVSSKVPKKLKDDLDRRGVNLSKAIRRGLEGELKLKKMEELEELLQKVDLSKVSDNDIIRDIRKTRQEH